jgi:hypothetical protein
MLLHFVFGDEHIGQKIEICKKQQESEEGGEKSSTSYKPTSPNGGILEITCEYIELE